MANKTFKKKKIAKEIFNKKNKNHKNKPKKGKGSFKRKKN